MNQTLLSSAIEAAVKKAFTELVARSKGEQIYAFALYSDEDAITLCPAANTLEYLEAAADKNEQAYYCFEPAEWKYEMEGADTAFNDISSQLYQFSRDNKTSGNFGDQLRAICVDVLARLKAEGFFHQVAGQEVFLIYTVSDSDQEPGIMEHIITRLNDDPYRAQYLDWMNTWGE